MDTRSSIPTLTESSLMTEYDRGFGDPEGPTFRSAVARPLKGSLVGDVQGRGLLQGHTADIRRVGAPPDDVSVCFKILERQAFVRVHAQRLDLGISI